jgi:hypothetical protein
MFEMGESMEKHKLGPLGQNRISRKIIRNYELFSFIYLDKNMFMPVQGILSVGS